MNRVDEILSRASISQVQWVLARLTARSDDEAARRIGKTGRSVYHWDNKKDLDEAVKLLLSQSVEAAGRILSQAAPAAAQALVDALSDKRQRIRAAKEILDRSGLPAEQRGKVGLLVTTDFNVMSDDELRSFLSRRSGRRDGGEDTGA